MLKKLMIFVVGGGIGAVSSYFITKDICERRFQKEIEELKEHFAETRTPVVTVKEEESTPSEQKPEVEQPSNILYTSTADARVDYNALYPTKEVKKPVVETVSKPEVYIIDRDAFNDESYDFENVSLVLYADGVLADSSDAQLNPIAEGLTHDILNQIIESDEDEMFVRSEVLHIDFNIYKDLRDYSEIVTPF